MKRFILKFVNRVGKSLSHRQRRFLLDRLGLGRLLGRLVGNQFEEISLPNGVNVTINSLYHAQLAKDGSLAYEAPVLQAVEDNLKEGSTFYDVGANIGVFTFFAASHVGDTGFVLAFEPEENNLACLRKTAQKSGLENVTFKTFAIGASDGVMTFDRRGGAFSGRLVDKNSNSGASFVTVNVRSIDSLVENGTPPPTLVKIDVEGGEGAVLEGMQSTLKHHGPIILCELHAFNPAGVAKAMNVLAEHDYLCQSLDGREISPKPGGNIPSHILARPR